jgi:hypothetical protein
MTEITKSDAFPPEPGDPVNDEGAVTPPEGPAQYVTRIASIDQQVGLNVMQALKHPETVAVLTTTVLGPAGNQHVVSVPLSPGVLERVQELLHEANTEDPERIPCVGFHCYINDEDLEAAPSDDASDD